MGTNDILNAGIDALFERISALIEESRKNVATAVNIAEVYTKYEIGRYIVENEQNGKYRAAYGKQVLRCLANKLTQKYGNGWSEDTLERCRKFFDAYHTPQISATTLRKLYKGAPAIDFRDNDAEFQNTPTDTHKFVLSWSHYLILMRIENTEARSFYEVECAKQNWSVRWLQRQVGSSLYERIALSSDKDKCRCMSTTTTAIRNKISRSRQSAFYSARRRTMHLWK